MSNYANEFINGLKKNENKAIIFNLFSIIFLGRYLYLKFTTNNPTTEIEILLYAIYSLLLVIIYQNYYIENKKLINY